MLDSESLELTRQIVRKVFLQIKKEDTVKEEEEKAVANYAHKKSKFKPSNTKNFSASPKR